MFHLLVCLLFYFRLIHYLSSCKLLYGIKLYTIYTDYGQKQSRPVLCSFPRACLTCTSNSSVWPEGYLKVAYIFHGKQISRLPRKTKRRLLRTSLESKQWMCGNWLPNHWSMSEQMNQVELATIAAYNWVRKRTVDVPPAQGINYSNICLCILIASSAIVPHSLVLFCVRYRVVQKQINSKDYILIHLVNYRFAVKKCSAVCNISLPLLMVYNTLK